MTTIRLSTAALFVVVANLMNFGCSHKTDMDTAALRNVVIEGSGIGVVVAELRRKREVPIEADRVMEAHKEAFRSY